MCGIAGVMFKHGYSGLSAGQALIDMLDGCQHRGPDSTGFALYEDAKPGELRLRFLVEDENGASDGVGHNSGVEGAIADIRSTLEEHGAEIVDAEHVGNSYRVVVRFSGDVQKLTYDMEHAATLISIGESLDIRKDVGSAHDVDEVFHVREVQGTHGLGHVRLATESEVKPEAAHPFWATGFTDIAIVHNGQITNYWKMRRRLGAARLRVPHGQRQRADCGLSGGQARQRGAPGRRAEDLDRRPRRHVLVPGVDQGRDRLRQGSPRGEADDHVRERRPDCDRLGGGFV